MGLIGGLLASLFGDGRNLVRETAEVFRENTEAAAIRGADHQIAALDQFGDEFAQVRQGGFDRFMDALNRVPRPALALGTLGLFVAAMLDPIWFASRMQGLALVPEPLWWLLGAIVSFYFGARFQVKSQDYQRSIAEVMLRTGQVAANIGALRALEAGFARAGTEVAGAPGIAVEAVPEADLPPAVPGDNPALDDWRRIRAE